MRSVLQIKEEERDGGIFVYDDFFNCKWLGAHEKMTFIALKSFTDNVRLICTPSIARMCKRARLNETQLILALSSLETKGVIKSERYFDEKRDYVVKKRYVLYDYPEIWTAASPDDLPNEDEREVLRIKYELEMRGYTVTND